MTINVLLQVTLRFGTARQKRSYCTMKDADTICECQWPFQVNYISGKHAHKCLQFGGS